MRVPAATPDTTEVEAADGAGRGGVSSAATRVTGANPAARTAARTKRPGGAVCMRMKRLFPPGGLAFASSGAIGLPAPSQRADREHVGIERSQGPRQTWIAHLRQNLRHEVGIRLGARRGATVVAKRADPFAARVRSNNVGSRVLLLEKAGLFQARPEIAERLEPDAGVLRYARGPRAVAVGRRPRDISGTHEFVREHRRSAQAFRAVVTVGRDDLSDAPLRASRGRRYRHPVARRAPVTDRERVRSRRCGMPRELLIICGSVHGPYGRPFSLRILLIRAPVRPLAVAAHGEPRTKRV